MGPKLLGWGKGETKYSIRLFPIGGFLAMEGEDEESGNGRAFCNKPAWQRFIILFAGAGMNLLLGLCLLAWSTSQMSLLGTNVVGRGCGLGGLPPARGPHRGGERLRHPRL